MMHKMTGKAKPNKGRLKASFVTSLSDLALCPADCQPSVTNLTGLIWLCINSSVERPDAQTHRHTDRLRGSDGDRPTHTYTTERVANRQVVDVSSMEG